MASVSDSIPVTVISDEEKTVIETEQGTVLRDLLLEHGFSVYRLSRPMVGWECPTNPREASGLDPEAVHGSASQHANCGGRGLCGTCGVELTPSPEPEHWHDRAAARFGYPRLSCCVTVTEPMQVQLLEKHVWGQLLPRMDNGKTTRAGED